MAEFRRIQITSFVILLLQFTEVAGHNSLSFTVRAGDEVILPCENVIIQDCSSTTWLFSRKGETAVALIEHGQVKDVIPKTKSDRLSVTEKCSLVIKNVTEEDVGRYTCRQFNKSGQQQGPDAVVHLSVVIMVEQKNTDDTVTLICSVLTYSECDHSVKWLYEGDENDVKITPHTCSASVSFPPHLHQKLLKCNVTDKKNGNTLLCNVGPQSSCKKTGNTTVGTDNTPTTPGSTTVGTDNTPTTPGWLLYIIVAVGVTALLAAIIIVVVIRRKKTKRNNTQTNENIGLSLNPAETQSAPETSQNMADPEGGVFYASISHTKKTSSKAQARGKDADADDEAVTYSTVKAPPSAAAAASADVSNLYATINKPNQ
ncbi:uncharacterized protein LOC116056200 [Sander lucioperca]|uniref:uncharacterized protein LOC116056200 n=1 Tax=Sander lucioperca TaxID=283035 RepID=UPI001653CA1C|nr:uncharacterized protein LOC116056200 [Sander lucioperca]